MSVWAVHGERRAKAMKHPENVEALILASPVGMGEKRALDFLDSPAAPVAASKPRSARS